MVCEAGVLLHWAGIKALLRVDMSSANVSCRPRWTVSTDSDELGGRADGTQRLLRGPSLASTVTVYYVG